MYAEIRNAPTEIIVQTVTLSHDREHPHNLVLFRCHRCGYQMGTFQGKITLIAPGLQDMEHQVVKIDRCPKCKENYVFMTQDSPRSEVRLILTPHIGHNIFWCGCHTQVFIYDQTTKYPQDVVCPTCKRTYKIADVL